MQRFEPIPNKHWRSSSGRIVSLYGASPFWTEAQRISEGWAVVQNGFTIRDNLSGTIGISRGSFATMQEASDWCSKANADEQARKERHAALRASLGIDNPIVWTKAKSNDGLTRHSSGEGYTIVTDGVAFRVDHDDWQERDGPCFRTLAKAKAWAQRSIMSDRWRVGQ